MVTNALDRFIGADVAEFDENEVVAAIMNLGVLQHIATDLVENDRGATLLVAVEERRTTFPLPMAMSGSGGSMFGAFLMESNMFGLRDMAVLGAMFGDFGWTGMAIYNHNPRRAGLPGATAMFMYGHQERKDVDNDTMIQRQYSLNALRASLGINYTFLDLFTAAFSASYSDIVIENDDDGEFLNAPDTGATMLIITPSLTIRRSRWDGYFLSQQSATLRYNYNHALSGESYHSLEFTGGYEQPMRPGSRVNLRGGAVWKSTENPLFEDSPSRTATSILSRNFSAMNYAGGMIGLEKQLRKRDWGSISSQTSWQAVYYDRGVNYDDDGAFAPRSEFNHGPATGIHFYLSRIALPAMGLVLAYNMTADLFLFNFSMGMSF